MIIVIGIVFMIISFAVSSKLKNKFKKYSQLPISSGLSGREVAEKMLKDHGIYDVAVTCVPGQLTDHYNPANRTVNLSEQVFHGRSAASAAVASHECGHAVQHASAYTMLEFRSTLVPLQNVSARVINFVFMAMLFGSFLLPGLLPFNTALLIIIGCYGVFTLFAFVTLPVEFDATEFLEDWKNKYPAVVKADTEPRNDPVVEHGPNSRVTQLHKRTTPDPAKMIQRLKRPISSTSENKIVTGTDTDNQSEDESSDSEDSDGGSSS